jgi:hypothetical protein
MLRYRLSAIAWLFSAVLAALLAPHLSTALNYLSLPFSLDFAGARAFWHWFIVLSQLLAAAVTLMCIDALWLFPQRNPQQSKEQRQQKPEQEQQSGQGQPPRNPLAPFFLQSQYPCLILGGIILTCVVVAYLVRQGYDMRHLYLLGTAALGVAVVFAVAAFGFALTFGPSKSSSSFRQAGAGPLVGLCLLQALGGAAALWFLALPLSWLLLLMLKVP